jgi:hypothetical protein
VGSMAVHTHPAVSVQVGEAATGQGLEEVVDLGPGVGAVPTVPQTHYALGLGVVVQRELTKNKKTTPSSIACMCRRAGWGKELRGCCFDDDDCRSVCSDC